MVKKLGVKCDVCGSILYKQGKCACGNLGVIYISTNKIKIYNNDLSFSILDLYFDNTNTLKYIQNNYLKEKSKIVTFDKKHLTN